MNIATFSNIEYIPHFLCQSCSAVASERRERERVNDTFIERANRLSGQERLVMLHICAGLQPQEIAAKMELSVKTVSTYRARVLEKLQLRSNVAVVLACERAGLLDGVTAT